MPVEKVLGELMQRDNGLMRGKGGSMHLTSAEHGVMGSYAIIGAHLPIACGAAWRAQYKGDKDVSVCFFGDGTTNIGAFHEALNFAAVWKLPVVFVCENNLYMEYTPIGDVTAVPSIRPPTAPRPTGSSSIVIDGNDADVVYRTAQTAFAKARAGDGPSLIECMTYRHSGHSRADPGASIARRASWSAGSSATRSRSIASGCKQFGVSDDDDRRRSRPSVRKDVDDATEACKAAPKPPIDILVHRRLRRWRLGMAELTYRDAVARGIAQEMTRDPDVVFLGEDVGQGRRRVQGDGRPVRAVRPAARARHADLRAGDPRRRDGRGDDRPEADRRDHVLGFLRGVLRLHRQRISQEPLHVERADSNARWWCAPATAPARASARSTPRASRTGA